MISKAANKTRIRFENLSDFINLGINTVGPEPSRRQDGDDYSTSPVEYFNAVAAPLGDTLR